MVFKGRRVLVVEDDMMIAMMMDDMLRDLGCLVIGPLHGLAPALTLVEARAPDGDGAIDVAFLDINLAGEAVFPLADVLRGRGVPLVFCTGYGDGESSLRKAYEGSAVLVKPYRANQLAAALRQALEAEPFETGS